MASDQTRATPERLYRLLADNATDVVTLHDVSGRYRYVSPSITSLTGYAPEPLLGTPGADRVHPDDIARVRAEMAAMEGVATLEYRLRHATGSGSRPRPAV